MKMNWPIFLTDRQFENERGSTEEDAKKSSGIKKRLFVLAHGHWPGVDPHLSE